MAPKTIGSAMSDIIAPAVRNERPNTAPPWAVKERIEKMPCWKSARPKMAMTMSGVPATISMPDSTARASHDGRPYSTIQIAVATAIGRGDGDPDDGEQDRPEDRVEEAA